MEKNPDLKQTTSISEIGTAERTINPLDSIIGSIKKTYEKVKTIFKKPLGPEVVAQTDRELVSQAELTQGITFAETVLTEGALQSVGLIDSIGPNPIDILESEGHGALVTEAVADLQESGVVLDSGESVAEVVVAHIEDSVDLVEQAKADAEIMERDGYCKRTKKLSEQAGEDDRACSITYIDGVTDALLLNTSEHDPSKRRTVSEQVALTEFLDLMDKVSDDERMDRLTRDKAAEMKETTTWIGEKEYWEAVRAIAELWKVRLRANPKQIIYISAGEVARETGYYNPSDSTQTRVKSDEWLEENILSCFTSEELAEFDDRLVFDEREIPIDTPPEDLDIILLDDWTIGGSSLQKVYQPLASRLPQYKDCIEVQCIAANEDRVETGFLVHDSTGTPRKIPLKSFFKAHNSPTETVYGARISGFHSTVDFAFEFVIREIVEAHNRVHPNDSTDMPPVTNIVRPYRTEGFQLTQVKRAQEIFDKT